MLLYILLLLFVILILKLTLKHGDYWRKRNVTQLKWTSLQFFFANRSLPEIYKQIYDEHKESHIGLCLGLKPELLVKDLDDVQAVLQSDFQSFYSRGILTNTVDLLADSILFMEDLLRWKVMRQKLSPVFTSAKLKNMFYILDKCARDFVEVVEDNQQMRLTPYYALYTYTTASISASIFGIDTQTKNTMNSPLLELARKALEPTFKNNFFFFISNVSPGLFKFLNLKFFGDHEEFFIGTVKNILDSRRHYTERRHDFIEICLELQKQGVMEDYVTGYKLHPTDELLAAQAFFFFIAGADTTANTMHFALLELSSNPKVLTKLHQEIDAVFENDVEELTYNEIDKMQYLDMVINETTRKYPPIGIIQRKCTKDTVLPHCKVKIEKDVQIAVPVYAIHRDEKYYPDPEQFDPQRFAPDNLSKLKKFSYLPFGEGNRNCIGARFARLQLKAGLAWLLRRFTLTEHSYKPERFERSFFAIRDANARYELISRDI